MNLKNLLNGFVHGFFIDDPTLQYVLLMLIKFGLIYIVFRKKKLLKSWICISICTYFFCGILIDVMCIMSIEKILPKIQIYFLFGSFKLMDLVGYFVIVLIATTVIFQIIIDIFSEIKQINCCKKNN